MRRIVRWGVAGMLVAGSAGCSALGGGSDQPSSAPPPSAVAPTGASAPGTGSPGPSATDTPTSAGASTPAGPDQPTTGSDLGQPVTTRTAAVDKQRVLMTVYPVVRDGDVSTLTLTLATVDARDKVQVAAALSDGNGEAGESSAWAADGIRLVDGKHRKLYLVASDGHGECVCSRNLIGVFLTKDVPLVISATFAAPPADVTTVDVNVPSFGTVKGVPVSS